jgi:hypothetical protein
MQQSLAALLTKAHPNSALRRNHPTGCRTGDMPHWTADTTDADHLTNTGFPDDYEPSPSNAHGSRWQASAYHPPKDTDVDYMPAVLFDLGANLPDGHPFAPSVDGRAAA